MSMLHRSLVAILLPSLLTIAQAAKSETRPATLKQDFNPLSVELSDRQQSLTSRVPDQWHMLITD
jgi:hypothetical protein